MTKRVKAVVFDWAGTTIDYGCFAPVKGFIDGFKSIGIEISNEMARKPMGLLKLDHTRAIAAMLAEPISEEMILRAYKVFEETLFANIEEHCDIKDYIIETVAALRKEGIKIGSTTGYTSEMMKSVILEAREQGYSPDFCITADSVPKGRPYPYMIWNNLMEFGISDPREAIKVGDTVADITEGKNANCWTVGVIMGSSELGLTRLEVSALTENELKDRKTAVRSTYYKAGADYVIDDMNELLDVVAEINRKLRLNEDRKLLTPGPLSTRQSVKYAMLTDHCTWDEEYKDITTSVINDITQISANDDYSTILLQGSGTYAVEAMIDSLCKKNEKILFLVNGEYGKRMLVIADKLCKNYDYLEFDMTQPIDVKTLEDKLNIDRDIDVIVFVHCETTTGIINPLEDLVKLSKSYGKKVLVDAMSSFAAYDIDMPGLDIDALAASSNKCLEGLPGLAFVIVKKELIAKCSGNSSSHSLDLFDQYQCFHNNGGKFRFTSPTNVLLALRQAIDEYKKEGGLPARKKRYMKNHEILTSGLEKLGFRSIIAPEYQSYIITTFELGNLDFIKLYDALKSKGFVIYPGKLTSMPTFRLGNIGDIYPEDIVALVDAIGNIQDV
ncbi:MAG: 2-aminoethylphosphonate--pyruvate transaminase [Ruminococcaceae bacterium]|nr:2-aminoethylphosphonate--pyruvate transaminase [Oscillospiraceae bacterium]